MKVAIVTIIDNNNYGNRLQNYAMQYVLEKHGCEVVTLKNETFSNTKKYFLIRLIKNLNYKGTYSNNKKRKECFTEFNNNIKFSKKNITAFFKNKEYDYIFVGSDQVWNPKIARLREVDLLQITEPDKRISYAASFGVSHLNLKEKKKNKIAEELKKFKSISVREETAKGIVEDLTNRNDVEVLLDPTMLLTSADWDLLAKRPKKLKYKKYILSYFLGKRTKEYEESIEIFAKNNNCEIINILDENDAFYETGPSEFIYLIKHAFLICTDSFHSCIFSIIYGKNFIVFDRIGLKIEMNSRINDLLKKFRLEDRKYCGTISLKNLEHDYVETFKILDIEKQKSNEFITNCLYK